MHATYNEAELDTEVSVKLRLRDLSILTWDSNSRLRNVEQE
uniref:Uncharacterized protein n=1 Tax=Pseudomonas fluorescens (strain SBW25) TaxID=216595 RepID=A0A0G4E4W7_PSEFS|nr:hypothetical protein PQBR57_0322 [Pseudomonas fluorescens SBW25]